ncbi:hypothetical protein ACFO5Q_02975 [Kordiimonas lipolytica]|uniref:Uncharacterized protein n=1 Tax=Kordiimonas lipolytica TaxID=1662421 RepID=A0ABV8U6I1_9PROT|nr:hypothetical protein [Kordiimonas lipolytica]
MSKPTPKPLTPTTGTLSDTTGQERSNEMPLDNIRMRTGQRLVFAGFGIAVIGLILYSMAGFSAEAAQIEPVFIKESLGVVGIGVVVWLIGVVKYLNGAIESNAADDHNIL